MKTIYQLGLGAMIASLLITSCTSNEKEIIPSQDDKHHHFHLKAPAEIPEPAFSFEELRNLRKKASQAKAFSKDELAAITDRIVSRMESNPHLYTADYILNMKRVLSVLNPEDYECDPSDDVIGPYVNASVSEWDSFEFLVWSFYSDFPLYDAVFFQGPSDPQYYGPDGEYSDNMESTFRGLKRFWNIDNSKIQMVGMHGTTFANERRVFEILQLLYPFDPVDALKAEALALKDFFGSDTFWNYNHPLFSLNAFAIGEPFNKIVMGDGIMMVYEFLGSGAIAPQGILAHEYAHQIQFSNGYFDDDFDTQAESTRRTELMADAYSAYFLAHRKGGEFRKFVISDFVNVFYSIGDCGFSNPGHHGTYNQRAAAAQWGIELYYRTRRGNNRILSAEQFFGMFEQSLNSIVECGTCLSD